MNASSIFFLQAVLVVALPYLFWRLAGLRAVLPLVVVQILAGVMLGPSVFGLYAPQAWTAVFGPERLPMLSGLQWLAVVIFCFLTGLHLREQETHDGWRATIGVSAGSIAVPFAFGAAAGWWMVEMQWSVSGEQATRYWFAYAMGVCSAVTALPVLGAVLREMGLTGTRLGQMALRCAAVNDAWIWLFLTVILARHGHQDGPGLLAFAAMAAAYLAFFVLIVRPALAWLLNRHILETELQLAIALFVVLVSACLAELAGLHHVMGGFIAGMVWPRQHAQRIRQQLEPLTVVVLLPFFFLAAGLRSQIAFADHEILLVFGVSTVIAVIGKLIGVAVPSRLSGVGWRESLKLGALLQTKGLVEVVVLTVLLDARIISNTAFSGLLLMAIATTVLARPLTMLFERLGTVRRRRL